ncbi:8-oxo-dGTP diphosphatase [Patescibacteria group bacterium]|jgi:8-oxo-dGTP diphosphatase/2-hydroxy-dATP diphosphatase|nr:8-oxo-dGTP diphosphatase [Patescibacteria group bacterium]
MRVLTLIFLRRGEEVLLGYKKRGFGMGQWNGVGGKVEEGESIEDGARRETLEEVGMKIGALNRFGIIQCDYRNVEKPGVIEIHLFDTHDFSGDPIETEEIKPAWYEVSEFPFDHAWPDDRHWVPWYLAGKKFRGYFLFDGYDTITEHELREAADV